MAEQPEAEQQTEEEEFSSLDELEKEGQETSEEEPASSPEEEPEEETQEEKERRKLAGKFDSPEELEKAYQELQKEKSRLGNEVGELRKEVRDFIVPELQAQKQSQPEQQPPSEEDFFDNPHKATERVVEERLKPIEQQLTQQQANEARQRFEANHPDWYEVFQSEDFQQWLEENPKMAESLQQADKNYDADTGSEILSLYKQVKGSRKTKTAEPSHDSESLQKASVESSKSEKSEKKKVYRSADIARLRREDPDRFRQLWPDILRAYEEDRVK